MFEFLTIYGYFRSWPIDETRVIIDSFLSMLFTNLLDNGLNRLKIDMLLINQTKLVEPLTIGLAANGVIMA